MSAADAGRLGLVDELVAAADDGESHPLSAAVAAAREIASKSPDAVAAAKEMFHGTWHVEEQASLAEETRLQSELLLSWNMLCRVSANLLPAWAPKVPYKGRRATAPLFGGPIQARWQELRGSSEL